MQKQSNNPFVGANGIKEKRAILSELSRQAKKIQQQLIEEFDGKGDFFVPRVNDILLQMYAGETQAEFKTFNEWKKQGKTVKKGEKAWVIWSKPRKVEKEVDEQKEEYEMFGLCFMFSETQVK